MLLKVIIGFDDTLQKHECKGFGSIFQRLLKSVVFGNCKKKADSLCFEGISTGID